MEQCVLSKLTNTQNIKNTHNLETFTRQNSNQNLYGFLPYIKWDKMCSLKMLFPGQHGVAQLVEHLITDSEIKSSNLAAAEYQGEMVEKVKYNYFHRCHNKKELHALIKLTNFCNIKITCIIRTSSGQNSKLH
jgi:hypothetical protein